MPRLTLTPPVSAIEPVTEVLHGVEVYRSLSLARRTETLRAPAHGSKSRLQYARTYLDGIPDREHIRERIRRIPSGRNIRLVPEGRKPLLFSEASSEPRAALHLRERRPRREGPSL